MTSPLGPGPLVYAHRGARAYARDNTVEAFRLAIDQGAHGIELDAWLTADGEVVVYHDDIHPAVGFITECRRRDLNRADPSIPTLAEALQAIPPPTFINLELKNGRSGPAHDRTRKVAAAVLPLIEHCADRLLVSSFDAVMLHKVRRLRADLLTGQLLASADPPGAIEWAARAGRDSVNVNRSWLAGGGTALVARASGLGLAVCAWTVNNPDEVKAFAAAGVAVIITDDPPTALEALNAV